ncbi:aspartate aminotransferase family protein [Aestuariispira insulae]|uniref:Acetylornithine aminotransferase n=1 Tax=Aestuariispira insulae TaxID=1461337 RepID=A0A3D9HF59_9PROT|nr:aspartate aminotransferase family protein [Aestuariispira insulae]RED48114.1 acetylornithine/N-succinyldiaminopimelate aminotransferase [Aestuariispira insulae]
MSSNDTAKQPTAVMNTYARFPETMVRGEGVYLFDAENRRYLDFYTGIAVNALGHCHPHLVKCLQDQAAKLWHVSNLYHIEDQERLAKRLTAHSFADVAFFPNTGAEALEGLIKLARRYHFVTGNPQRWRIITASGAFHGRSLATISAANNPKHLEGFGPKVEGFDHVPFGNMNELRAAITEETAAILVEPIQGEGGINAAEMGYLKELRRCADEFGLLLILDEVQCGNGRTGKMWAHEWAEIKPDALATAKGLGGGFPVAAILATNDAAQGLTPGTHGTTFGGNPLAMAVANAVLDVLEGDGFMDHVIAVSGYLDQKLAGLVERHPTIFTAKKGFGLMLGLKCTDAITNGDIIGAAKAEGLLLVGASDNVIRILPPLTIENSHVDDAIAILDKVAAAQARRKVRTND